MRFSASTILFLAGLSFVSSQAIADDAPAKADPNLIVLGDREPVVVHFKDVNGDMLRAITGVVTQYAMDHSGTQPRHISDDGCTDKSYTVNGTRCTHYDSSMIKWAGISVTRDSQLLYEDGQKDSTVKVGFTVTPSDDGGFKIGFPSSVKIESAISVNAFFTSVFRSTKTPIYKTNDELKQAINSMFDNVAKGAASGDIFMYTGEIKGEYSSDYPAASLISSLSLNAGHDIKADRHDDYETVINPSKYDPSMQPFLVSFHFYPHKNGSIAKYAIKHVKSYSNGHSDSENAEARKKIVVSVLSD